MADQDRQRAHGFKASATLTIKLAAFARPYLWLIGVALVATLLFAACEAGRIFLGRTMLNDVFGLGLDGNASIETPEQLAAAWDTLKLLSLAALGIAIGLAVFGFAHRYIGRYLVARILVDLQNRVGGHLLLQSMRFFHQHRQGELYARLGSDIGSTGTALTLIFSDILVHPIRLLVATASAFWFSWQLAILLILLAPLVFVPLANFGRTIRRRARGRQQAVAQVFDALHQMLSGIRIVKAFRREDHAIQRLEERNERFLKDSLAVVRARTMSRSVLEGMNNLLMPVMIILGGGLVLDKPLGIVLSIPDLVGFLAAVALLYEPAKRLVAGYNSLQESLAGAERVFEVLDTEPDLQDAPDAVDLPTVNQEIRFDGVSFAYEETTVLHDISFSAQVGQIVAIVGPSGAGKSTLVDLIPRFYDPTKGRVLIDGVDVRKIRGDSLLSHIAVVTQEPFLFNASILENIRYGRPEATLEEVEAAARAANVHDVIMGLDQGYDTEAGERGSKLSGGERQRVTIARALLRNAAILILDEATSSLDSESERLVQEALDRLMEGRTTFVIAHRLSTVRNANTILVINEGRICEQGTHDALLLQQGLYHHLYTMQSLSGAPPDTEAAKTSSADQG